MKTIFMSLLASMIVAIPAFAQVDDVDLEEAALLASTDEVVIELNKGRRITGQLGTLTQFTLETKFGEANIPLAEVDGIKLHIDDDDSSVIAFKNGDIVTGKLKLEILEVVTDWGDANVKLASVETIMINQAGSFYQDASVGKNLWRFGDTKSLAKSVTTNSPTPRQNRTTQTRQNNTRFRAIQQPGNRFGG